MPQNSKGQLFYFESVFSIQKGRKETRESESFVKIRAKIPHLAEIFFPRQKLIKPKSRLFWKLKKMRKNFIVQTTSKNGLSSSENLVHAKEILLTIQALLTGKQ